MMDIQKFEDIWPSCNELLDKLRDKTLDEQVKDRILTAAQYINIYQKIYNNCISRKQSGGDKLYKKYEETLNFYLLYALKDIAEAQNIYKLKKVRKIWNSYKLYSRFVRNLFCYLDRYHIPQSNSMPLSKKSLSIFKEIVLERESEDLLAIYMREIQKIRATNEFINAGILKQYIEIFTEINDKQKERLTDKIYSELEVKYLINASDSYKRKYKQFEKMSCGEYLENIDKLYSFEKELFERCVGESKTLVKINQQFSKQLVKKFKPHLLDRPTGLSAMLQNNKRQTLRLMNDLFKRLDNFEDLKQKFGEYIQKQLQQFLEQKRGQLAKSTEEGKKNSIHRTFIAEIIKFHKQKFNLIEECFPANPDFNFTYKFSIEKVLNEYNSVYNISQILAKYSDNLIRQKKMQSEQFEQEIKYLLNIFNCLVDKDMYLKSYKQYLARRLINNPVEDLDREKSFIAKLKQNCGINFTQGVQNIITDHQISSQECNNFKKYLFTKLNRQDFEIRILSEGIWPTQELFTLQLPPEIQQKQKIFNEYFSKNPKYNYKNYKLSHLQSRVVYTYFVHQSNYKIAENKHEQCYLNMNVLQGTILYYLYVNREYFISENQIISKFENVKPALLLGNLKIMCDNIHNIVICKTNEHTLQPIYRFNYHMIAKKKRIQYNQFKQQSEFKKQSEIQNDRSLAIEMAIVKIMKTRKKSKFQTLVQDVAKLLRNFQPSIKQIKQSIEKMVMKDYIERDQKQINQYRYKQ